MVGDIKILVERVLARAPAWIRRDLMSTDAAARQRAEEALAAMIAGAIAKNAPADR